MKIEIMSHKQIKEAVFTEPTSIISIDSDNAFPDIDLDDENILQITRLKFDDADVGPANLFSKDQAHMVLDHATRANECKCKLICQCEAGISRSAAVAAAISLIYNGTDAWVFQDPKYCPNMHVYRTILNVYGIHKDYFK